MFGRAPDWQVQFNLDHVNMPPAAEIWRGPFPVPFPPEMATWFQNSRISRISPELVALMDNSNFHASVLLRSVFDLLKIF